MAVSRLSEVRLMLVPLNQERENASTVCVLTEFIIPVACLRRCVFKFVTSFQLPADGDCSVKLKYYDNLPIYSVMYVWLLTTYTHDSEIQAITEPPLISTIHK
jgi:hypothetical protein